MIICSSGIFVIERYQHLATVKSVRAQNKAPGQHDNDNCYRHLNIVESIVQDDLQFHFNDTNKN